MTDQEATQNTQIDAQEVDIQEGEVLTEQDGEAVNGPITIKAVNPSKEEMTDLRVTIAKNYDFDVSVKATKFNFKKSKDKATGIETIREAVEIAVPVPTVDGIIAIISGEGLEEGATNKMLALLLDVMEGEINSQVRSILYEDTTLTAATFPIERLSWKFISEIPPVQRRGGGIPKEIWDAFEADYIAVMPDATGKTVDQVTNAAKCLRNKLTAVRTQLPVLNLLVDQMAIYAKASADAEDYEDCLKFLVDKADMFLNVTDEDLLANL